jgi:hypothetical protein
MAENEVKLEELVKRDIEKLRSYVEAARRIYERIKELQRRIRVKQALKKAGIEIAKPEMREKEFERALREAGIEVI